MTKKEIIEEVRKLRLSDLSDALDVMGLVGTQVMSPNLRPLQESMFKTGCMAGYAFTEEFVFEKNDVYEDAGSVQEYYKRMGKMFENLNVGEVNPFAEFTEDTVMVVDFAGEPIGLFGSENMMAGMNQGAVGYVIDGGIRDSYEVKLENIPVWSTVRTCNHFYGRIHLKAIRKNVEITCCGVKVKPGDIVCGDDDAVLVIPYEKAELVLQYAKEIREIDQRTRKSHYEKANKPFDDTLN